IEKKRRNKLIRTKVFVKIYLNHKLVYKTTESQLQNDFTVKWAQIFNVFMISRPDSVILQLFEKVDSTERMIAEVLIPTPDDNRTCQNYALEDFDFSSSEEFYMYLKTSNQSELFFTSGKLKAGLGWGVDENDTVLAPPKPQNASSAVLYAEDMKNFDAIAAL
ncbi:coiled-coil and C2 domain-containing 2A, partial [Brachionus plicatilis]